VLFIWFLTFLGFWVRIFDFRFCWIFEFWVDTE